MTEANGAELLEKAVAVQPDIIILNTAALAEARRRAVAALREGARERRVRRLPVRRLPSKILIVDDEAHLRMLIQQTLEELEDEGVELLTASNGEEALETIQCGRPNLVFLDVMMPKLSGFDVCERAKQTLGLTDVYIVLLTAKGRSSIGSAARRSAPTST